MNYKNVLKKLGRKDIFIIGSNYSGALFPSYSYPS